MDSYLPAHSCRVFVGPHMHNFEDIVEQINAAHDRRHSASNAVTPLATPATASASPAISTVKDARELALALSDHFLSHTSTSHAADYQELLQTLAVQSLQSHERKLLEWLGTHDDISSK